MRRTVRLTTAILLGLVIVAPGCAEENTGDLSHRDLGDDNRALVPTGLTFTDPAVAKGSAQWQKLREPSFAGAGDAKLPAGGALSDAEAGVGEPEEVGELRELIADYNAAIAEKNYEDLIGFFVESQVETAEKLVKLVPELATKVSELNAALPAPNAELSDAAASIAMTKLFHLDVGAIKVASDSAATGELTSVSGGGVIKFVVEDGDWYLEHPLLTSVADSLAELEQGPVLLDQAITGIKGGTVTGDALDTAVDDALDMLILLTPEDAGDAPDSDDTVGT